MKIKLILRLLVFIMFLTAAASMQVLADTTSDSHNNYTYPMSTYKKPVIQPFSLSTSGQTENISAASGNLEITQTDLNLKGKNGLDFNLTRMYSTSDALLYEPKEISQPYYDFYVQGYYITGTEIKETYTNGVLTGTTTKVVYFCAPASGSTTGLPYIELPQSFPQSVYSTYWSTSQQAQKMADNFNTGIYDTSVTSTSGNNTILTVTKYSDKQDFAVQLQYQRTTAGDNPGSPIVIPGYYWDATSSLTVTDKYFNLGTGWSFDLPYVETRGTTDNYLHLGSKGTYHFTFDRVQWALNAAQMITADYDIGVAFDEYKLKDITLYYLIYKKTHPYNNSEMDAYFMVVEKDGKTSYFGSDGRLLGIKDRFGNEIRFLHTKINGYPVVTQVIDSVGRKVNIKYETSKVTVEVVDDTNTSNNRQIYYNKTVCPGSTSEYLLSSVIDAESRATQYTYEQKSGNFCYRKKDPYPGSNMGTDYYECLKSIIYPTGGKTVYNYNDGKYSYMNLGVSGFLHFNKIVDRADYAKDGTKYNYKSYKYYNYFNGDGAREYDGYPAYSGDSVPNGYNVKTDITDAIGNVETDTYSYIKNPTTNKNDLLPTDILNLGAEHKKETINSYDTTSKLLTQSNNRTYNKTSGKYLDSIENYRYDNLKNVLYYWDPQANGNTADIEHKTAYTYGKFSIMTSKTYKRDAGNTIKEQYTLSTDGKTITKAQVYENNVLKKQTGYTYDSYGNVTEQKDYLDNWIDYISTHYDYTDNDSSRNGKFNGLYLTRNWVDGVKDADGYSIVAKSGNTAGTIDGTYKYDWFGNAIQKQDGQGNISSYTYDKLNRITAETNPDTTSKTYSYTTSTSENSVLSKDERGTQIKTIFDEFGNLTYVMDMASGQYLNHYIYDSLFRLQTEDNNNTSLYSRTINYKYYSDGRVRQNLAQDKDSKVLNQEDFTYDDANSNGTYNKMTKTVLGNTTSPSIITVAYMNKLGQVEKQGRVHNGAELLDTFKYDYLGNKTEEKSARAYTEAWSQSYTAKYEYDYAGKPVKVFNVNGDYMSTQYDAMGRTLKVTDIAGNKASIPYSSTYIYDSMGRVIEEDIPFQNTNGTIYNTIKKHYYDRNSNVILEKVSGNKPGQAAAYNQTGYEYNSRNMLTKVITYNNGSPENFTQYFYDAAGNKVRMYSGLSAPLTITGLDNVTPSTDAVYSVTKYDYDQFSRLRVMTDPMGREEMYINDLNGNLVQKTDRNGSTITMTYDGLNRLITNNVSNTAMPSYNASLGYTYTLTGNRESMSGENGTTYTYDDLGRLITESEGQVTKEYTYDASNNRKSFILKLNGTVKTNTSYTYDNLNRLYQVFENGLLTATYTYDANGNRQSMTYSNGDSESYTYNLANKVETLTNKMGFTVLSGYTYEYSLDGNQTRKTDNTGKTTDYTYDGLGRLTNEAAAGEDAISYTYDDSNNRRTMTAGNATTTYEYGKDNRLTTETKVIGGVSEITRYGYDNNGNQVYKSTETIKPAVDGEEEVITASVIGEDAVTSDVSINEYDGFNRVTKVTTGSTTAVYTYNGDGLRTSKTVNGVITNQVWDGDQIALELNGTGAVTGKYIRGINLIAAEDGVGTRKYYLFNGHGDVVQLSGTDGNVTRTYDYDAFGVEKNPDSADTNVFRYCGEYWDSSSGTYYLRARYYDPATSRMLSEDSYPGDPTDPLSLNLYTFCHNNPIRYIDPSGQKIEDATRWLARALIGNPINNWFTKNGWFKDVFRAAGFVRTKDLNGTYIYHATMDCLQQYGGYNNFYDTVFYFATSMDKEFFQFKSGGTEYRLWAWKGDYLNLGAGAEMGIYKQMTVAGYDTPQWLVDQNLAMHMTLQLQYKGKTIVNWDPAKDKNYDWDKVWWVTGFNPYYTNVKTSDLKAIYSVTFNTKTMYTDFYNKFGDKNSDYYDSRWTGWDDKKFSATFNF